MSPNDKPMFVYVTYIRTTQDKLWNALTNPEFIKRFWMNTTQESDWKKGSSWKMIRSDGTLSDSGEVLEVDPPKKLVLKWRHESRPDLKEEGYSRMTYELEPSGASIKLTVTHEAPGPKFLGAVSNGWPLVLASLKSFLETGEALQYQCANEKPASACAAEQAQSVR